MATFTAQEITQAATEDYESFRLGYANGVGAVNRKRYNVKRRARRNNPYTLPKRDNASYRIGFAVALDDHNVAA